MATAAPTATASRTPTSSAPRWRTASRTTRSTFPAMPTAFVAGATGYTGRALMQLFAPSSSVKTEWKPRPHARAAGKIDGAVVCDPRDVAALTDGMRGCDAVVQLIGTVRARFAEGDYDDIDYGTTV